MTHFDEIRAVTADAARLAAVPTRPEMMRALLAWIDAEREFRDALRDGRFDDLPDLNSAAAVAYRALLHLIDRLPGGEHADRADPDGPCYDATVEFDRNRA